MKKIILVLLLSTTFVYASSAAEYTYQAEKLEYAFLKSTAKVLKNLYVDVDFVRMLTLVDNRFENEDFLNAPKRIDQIKPLFTLSYRF